MPLVESSFEERALVTGGAGFIGSHLVDALLNRGAREVVVVDNLVRGRLSNLDAARSDRLRVIEADIRDRDALAQAMRGVDTVYHLAAQSTVLGAARDVDYTFTTNVVGTYNVLRVAHDERVKRVLFTSSREVYGEPLCLPVDEGHPLMSINSYGASKVSGEALCRAFTRESELETVVLRLANVFGPRDHGRVIPHWIEQARAGRELVVYGGEQVIDFIWVGHVVEAILRAASSDRTLPPINVASGTGTRILDLARRISQVVGHANPVKIEPRRTIEVARFIGNVERMTQLLGLAPPTDPLANLLQMVRPLAATAA